MIEHHVYPNRFLPGAERSEFACSVCGECWEPAVMLTLDSHRPGPVNLYGEAPAYYRKPEPYRPYGPLVRWLAEHRACEVGEY